MKFVVNKDLFAKLLYIACCIVERHAVMPILTNVKISASGSLVSLSATNFDVSFVGKIASDVEAEGSITVDAKMLYDYVKELPNLPIQLHLLSGGRLELSCRGSRSRMNGIPSSEYPEVKGVSVMNAVVMQADKIYEMLEKTSFSVSTDEARFNLNGVYVETIKDANEETKLRFVATDTYRLAVIDRDSGGFLLPDGIIIPRKGLSDIKKVLDGRDEPVHLLVCGGFFTISVADIVLGVRLIDGHYPDYRLAIPQNFSTEVELDRLSFLSAVRRASLITDETKRNLMCILSGEELSIFAESAKYGDAVEKIPVLLRSEETQMQVAFSPRYLQDALGAMSGKKVVLRLNGQDGPALLTTVEDPDFICVVMPTADM